MGKLACIVLAAGMGTRMKSARPKVLHAIAGRTLLGHVLNVANQMEAAKVCVVAGPDMDDVADEARSYIDDVLVAVQSERLGTGHAAKMAKDQLKGFTGTVLVLYGDVPLIRSDSLADLVAKVDANAPVASLGFEAVDPSGYGRFVIDDEGFLQAIVEHKDASDAERAITMCNSGIMAVEASHLWAMLDKLSNDNASGEYYLTDIVGLTVDAGLKVSVSTCSQTEVAGINDRRQLAAMEQVLQNRLRDAAMMGGATLVDPNSVYFSADTVIGRDVLIEPDVIIGPGVTIGDGARILGFSHIEKANIGAGAIVGPFARLRPEAVLDAGAKVGNFVEIKKSRIESGAKVNHFTYIGDARVGAKANIGAGTITCNYDGKHKHFTDIGANVFIGSNSSLVAPVQIGEGAYVGSGSVITKDVPAGDLAVTRPKQIMVSGWATRLAEKRAKEDS